MDDVNLAPLVGILGCVGVIVALLYPYVAADGSVATYYGSGLVNPLVAGLLALVTIIVLAAGREARTDPGIAAGAGLVFGLFIFLMTLGWGMTTRLDAVAISELHRWVVPLLALLIPVGSLWYSRALGVF
ncbi:MULTISPECIES: DUF7548 family protein [Salinibaculum]|uniref:DUF7548 family protein n=1 Tax=Salinibaculum TaxID=2732368 RepID=UPI0030CB6BE7